MWFFSFFSTAKVRDAVFACGGFLPFPLCKFLLCLCLNVPECPQDGLYPFAVNKTSVRKDDGNCAEKLSICPRLRFRTGP